MFELIMERNDIEGIHSVRIRFDDEALRLASQSRFDRLLLGDCEKPNSTIADKLLALELIARRSEEAASGGGS